jgi:hypothetical protein
MSYGGFMKDGGKAVCRTGDDGTFDTETICAPFGTSLLLSVLAVPEVVAVNRRLRHAIAERGAGGRPVHEPDSHLPVSERVFRLVQPVLRSSIQVLKRYGISPLEAVSTRLPLGMGHPPGFPSVQASFESGPTAREPWQEI